MMMPIEIEWNGMEWNEMKLTVNDLNVNVAAAVNNLLL